MRKPGKTTRLYQQVAEALTKEIASGGYKVGGRLPAERELATNFNVSRPTIREAVIALELDGLVEVKIGAGVFVKALPQDLEAQVSKDIGPFELTEARILFEGEVAAQAATQITDDEIAELEALLKEMGEENKRGDGGEEVDRRFHMLIAEATRNGAMAAMIENLWTIRLRSPQINRILEKSRAIGNKPVVSEHAIIVDALKARDPQAARLAMRDHLSRVLNYLLDASEVELIEQTKAQLEARRARFKHSSKL